VTDGHRSEHARTDGAWPAPGGLKERLSAGALTITRVTAGRVIAARASAARVAAIRAAAIRAAAAGIATAGVSAARVSAARVSAARVSADGRRAAGMAFGRIGRRAVRLPGSVWSRLAVRRMRAATAGALAIWLVAGGTLFICYLHVSRTSPVSSDGASNALQAWDMLHHNLLLRGWRLSDVSFYTTELPEYMLVERLRGLTPDVVHVASAMTYTLLVLLAALLAKGRTTGRAAMARCLLAAGIMLAPQAGDGVSVLIGSPDHAGSAVPVLVVFLIVDRAPRRWYVPIATGLTLAWALVADGIVLFTGILPMVAVGLARAYQSRIRLRRRRRQILFELALAAAALGAIWLARAALKTIAAHGGFAIWPVPSMLASTSELPHYLSVTGRGLLLLFGASFFGQSAGLGAGLAGLHLIGLGLAAWGTCAAIRRFPSCDPAAQLLAAGTVITLVAFGLGTRAQDLLSARDITAVLPFSAALAGRMLAGRLASARLLPALAVVGAGYLISLGQVVSRPPVLPQDASLASWLAARHLTYGLAGYWDANITTLDSAGRVRVRSALADGLRVTGDYWEVRSDWYQPTTNDATFIVLVPSPPGFTRYPTIASVRHTFGQPARIYYLGSDTILVWNKNLLADLGSGRPPPARQPAVTPPAIPIPAPPSG